MVSRDAESSERSASCDNAGRAPLRKASASRPTDEKTLRQPTRKSGQGKLVCVTGGTGFLGYQLVRQLRDLGADVRIHTLPPREHPPTADLPINVHCGDIRDPDSVRRAIEDCAVV